MAGTTFALVPQLAGTRPLIRLPASGEVTVGRSAGAQIQLNAAFISRRHARLIAEAGRAYVVPLCRDDKLVTVNGVPAARGARVELRAGDAVSFVKEEADFAYRVERRAPLDAIRKVCLLLDETHRVAGPQLDARAARRRHAVDRDELVVAAQRHDVGATRLGDQPRVSPRDERRVQLDLGPGTASDRDLTRRREPDEGARARELGHQRECCSRHLSSGAAGAGAREGDRGRFMVSPYEWAGTRP